MIRVREQLERTSAMYVCRGLQKLAKLGWRGPVLAPAEPLLGPACMCLTWPSPCKTQNKKPIPNRERWKQSSEEKAKAWVEAAADAEADAEGGADAEAQDWQKQNRAFAPWSVKVFLAGARLAGWTTTDPSIVLTVASLP